MKNIKITVLVLAMCLVFASCSSGGADQGGGDAETTETTEQSDTQNDGETATERIYPDLAAVDYGGHEFTFLARTINHADWAEWDHRDLYAEELNGDVINDAVFNRNKKIEEKYNIAIKQIIVENPQVEALLLKSVKAGDDIYDVVCPHFVQFPAVAQAGNYVDFFSVPCLDLTRPWWNQGIIRDLSIIGKLFIMQGDLLILDNDAMEAMIFNKKLHRENELENLYDTVKKGEWTFDKLISMSKGISKDLNGDGKMYIKDDLFGCILQSAVSNSFIVSGGEKICGKDENDYPIITFGSERCYRIMDAISELMLDEDNVVNLHRYEGKFPVYDEQVKMMEENRALFSWIRMRIVERLRGMETDFGILPLPKLDKNQPKYITHNDPHAGVGLSIPVTASDLERTGTILEDLAAESRYTLQPAYYEINLRGKFTRDDESQEMLDIILGSSAYDIGYVYDFGNFAMGTILHSGRDKKSEFASPFEKARDKMQRDIDKTVAAYEKLD